MKALNVIPAGIQCFQVLWTPAFAGVTVWTNENFLKLTALGPTRRRANGDIACAYDLEVEEQLMPILPAENEEGSSEPGHSADRKKPRVR